MTDLELLAGEVKDLRREMEGLRATMQERSFLPLFYKRAVVVCLAVSGATLFAATYAGVQLALVHRELSSIHAILSDWTLYEITEIEE